MSNPNNQKNDLNTEAALLATTGGKGSGAQERLAAILEKKFAAEAEEKEAEAQQILAFKTAQLNEIQRMIDMKAAAQERCPHLKENYKSALGGQRDHKGNTILVCQFCQKEFINYVPPLLQIPGEAIGGPQ
jgi:hypothetical protein